MKPSYKSKLGISLIVLSLFFFIFGVYQVMPSLELDSPCSNFDFAELNPPTATRIAYCVNNNLWFSGISFSGNGYSLTNEVHMDVFNFNRENQVLIANAQSIQSQEAYRSSTYRLSANPWLIVATHSNIRNEGLVTIGISDNVLKIVADVHEAWYPNPLGLVILVTGIWLYRNSIKDGNVAQQSLVPANPTG